MGLQDYDNDYDEAEMPVDANQFPDGTYELRITDCVVREKSEEEKTYVIHEFVVVGGADGIANGLPASNMIVFSPTNEYAAKNLKYINEACGLKIKPGDLNNEEIRKIYRGYVLSAKKVTKTSNGAEFCNWQYWKLIAKPDDDAADGGTIDEKLKEQGESVFGTPPATEPDVPPPPDVPPADDAPIGDDDEDVLE